MTNLKIKNIGAIKDVDINLNKINILMGPQSSGKSTIAKIISYCQWVEKRFMIDGEYKEEFSEQFMDFHRVSEVYFNSDSLIDYRSEYVHILYSNGIQETNKINNSLNSNFLNYKTIYIPAERNFVSTISNLRNYKRNNDNIMNFLYDWYEVKKKYEKHNKFPILNLGVSYYHIEEKDSDILVLNDGQKELLLNFASSGLQSVLPLLLLIDHLTTGLYNENMADSVNEKKEAEKIINFFIQDFLKKMDNNEIEEDFINKVAEYQVPFNTNELKELSKNVEKRIELMKYNYSSIIVEEPEQNLFPKAQRDLIYWIMSLINNKNRNHQLLLTTHSPFILYALNNCMMGGFINDKLPAEEKIEFSSERSWIDPKLISVWEIQEGKGTLRNIQDPRTGTIDKNYFNSIMNEVMNEYYEMLGHL